MKDFEVRMISTNEKKKENNTAEVTMLSCFNMMQKYKSSLAMLY